MIVQPLSKSDFAAGMTMLLASQPTRDRTQVKQLWLKLDDSGPFFSLCRRYQHDFELASVSADPQEQAELLRFKEVKRVTSFDEAIEAYNGMG